MDRESARALRQFGGAVAALVLVGTGLYYAQKYGWIFHDQLTNVASKGWELGEYKICSVWSSVDQTSMVCDSDNVTTRVYKVRFWGDLPTTLKEPQRSQWQCRRNNSEPALTCEDVGPK